MRQALGRRAGRVASAPVALCLFLGLRATPARAADTDRSEGAPSSPADVAAPPASSAQELAERAYELHSTGDFAASIATYLKAYELSNAGVILLNIATIYDRKLHERDLAADYYRRYLHAADAEPDLVLKATQRLTTLKQEDSTPAVSSRAVVAEPRMVSVDAPAAMPPLGAPRDAIGVPDDPGTERGHELRTAGIVTGSVGLGGVAASVVLGLLAKGKNDDANALCNGAACSSSEGVHLAHEAGNLATASTISFFAGLALAGGGLTMIVLAPPGPGGARAAAGSRSCLRCAEAAPASTWKEDSEVMRTGGMALAILMAGGVAGGGMLHGARGRRGSPRRAGRGRGLVQAPHESRNPGVGVHARPAAKSRAHGAGGRHLDRDRPDTDVGVRQRCRWWLGPRDAQRRVDTGRRREALQPARYHVQ